MGFLFGAQAATPAVGNMWFTVMLLLAGFGAFGGLLGSLNLVPLRRVLAEGIRDYGSKRRAFWCVLVGVLTGAGGAITFGIVLVLDGKLEQGPLTDKAMILLSSCAVGAGFVGHRLLKRLGERLLEEEVDSLRDEAKETKDDVAAFRAQTAQLAAALGFAGNALSRSKTDTGQEAKQLRQGAIPLLRAVIPLFPEMRTPAIFLGRLHRQLGELEEAITELGAFLAIRRKARLALSQDDAVVHFNRACYYNLMASAAMAANDERNAESLRILAWEELKLVARIHNPFIEDAKADPDLAAIEKEGVRAFVDLK